MPPTHTADRIEPRTKSWVDRALSFSADVRPGEGATALLMLANIFLLLVCYSVIKTVREPLILLGGGAEVRSYAAAGQALLLMGLVPLYGWVASRVDRARLLVTVTLFFVAGIELFALAVAAHTPYVGVAFFVWVGIFNMSLVAQFWSFANDIYSEEAGARLFPLIAIGMTAGAPLGSFVAARLFRSGIAPQAILQVSAVLLAASLAIYLRINAREERRAAGRRPPLAGQGGFGLVMSHRYLRLIAALVVLLNVVNTTGEYLIARLLSNHAGALAASTPGFDAQAYIGAFSGDYQFWVNVAALLLQAFVASRLVKYRGLAGVLLALPLIALGGYAIIAAGAGFSVVRWIKTAENATDYSIMNTARQLLWLPTSREEKYKAKQAIDTFFVRAGDVVSALVVYVGASILHLRVEQFARANVALTLVWIGVAMLILRPRLALPRIPVRPLARAACILVVIAAASPAFGQGTREDLLAARQADKARALHPYEPDTLERRLAIADSTLFSLTDRPFYPTFGGTFAGGGLALGTGYRARYGDTGAFDARLTWSTRTYRTADARLTLPSIGNGRATVAIGVNRIDAPGVAFYRGGNASIAGDRASFGYTETTAGVGARVRAFRALSVGGAVDFMRLAADPDAPASSFAASRPDYRRSRVFAEFDSRTSPGYTKRGALYRAAWSDYAQTNAGSSSFGRADLELERFVPLRHENVVLAFRAIGSATRAAAGQEVPYFLLPDLGGSHALRGYPAWRFRDRDRVLLTGEYRWAAGPLVDMALFLDAGQVAGRLDAFAWREFRTTYGVGLSLHAPTSTVTRIEVARTREGTSLVLSFGPSF